MIRIADPEDAVAIADVAIDSGLFPEEARSFLDTMMGDHFASERGAGHVCIVDDRSGLVGTAYFEPAPAADGTWYLTMIAVRRDRQGEGCGAALMRHVEADLRARDQRLLLVETSGTSAFERTRRFYLGLGYEQEAVVRDYYEPGDDMVLFRKALDEG